MALPVPLRARPPREVFLGAPRRPSTVFRAWGTEAERPRKVTPCFCNSRYNDESPIPNRVRSSAGDAFRPYTLERFHAALPELASSPAPSCGSVSRLVGNTQLRLLSIRLSDVRLTQSCKHSADRDGGSFSRYRSDAIAADQAGPQSLAAAVSCIPHAYGSVCRPGASLEVGQRFDPTSQPRCPAFTTSYNFVFSVLLPPPP